MADSAEQSHNPLNHSVDSDYFEFPGQIQFPVYEFFHTITGGAFGLTKFMLLELIVAGLLLLVFIPLARRIAAKGYARGPIDNFLEVMIVFVGDQIVKPAIGEEDARPYVPFFLTTFFFILFSNLIGLLPWSGSPTAALGVTIPLALCVFILIHLSGIQQLGVVGYAQSIVPHVPLWLYLPMLAIELLGHIIKPTVLAFRLFVNMVAGHTVLFVILNFIALSAGTALYFFVTPLTVLTVTALMMLELLVAFLQAYVFVFLSALFIGAAMHPQH